MHVEIKRLLAVFWLGAACAVLTGCQEPSPEAKLEAAGEELDEKEQALKDVEQQIEDAEAQLSALRDQRAKLREKVRTLEERVAARATDVALFRSVQSALLLDEDLFESAIAVEVEDGIVTLRGTVRTRDELQKAVQRSRAVPGVKNVITRVRVNDPAAES